MMIPVILTVRGKTATIYQAERLSDGKEVCIKVLFAFDPILSKSNAFCNERDILAKCHHPNIIRCYCTRQTQLCKIIELEYAPNGSVQNLLPLHADP